MKKLLNWVNQRIYFIGVVTLFAFIPLYPKFPLFNVPNTYVAIRFEDLLLAFLFAVFLLKTFLERKNIFQDRITRLFLLYFLVGAISCLSAILITKNVTPNLVILHWLRRIEYMGVFFIALASVKKIQDIKDYFLIIFLATFGVIIYGIGQKYFAFPVVSTMNAEFSKGVLLELTDWTRVSSTFAGHYDLAAYLIMVISLMAGAIIAVKNKIIKLIVLILSFLAFYLLILTASQTSSIAYFVAILVVLLLNRKFFWIIPVLIISVMALSSSDEFSQRSTATIKTNLALLSEAYRNFRPEKEVLPTATPSPVPVIVSPTTVVKIIATPTPTIYLSPTPTPREKRYVYYGSIEPTDAIELTAYRSTKIRFDTEWPRAIRAFRKNPLLGTGYSSITLATDNDYLRSLGETGLLGFVCLFLIFAEITRKFFKYFLENKTGFEKTITISIFGAFIGLLVNAVFIDVLESSKVAFELWLLLGIMIGLINLPKEQPLKND